MTKVMKPKVEREFINCPHIKRAGLMRDHKWPVEEHIWLQLCDRCYALVSNSVLRSLFTAAMPRTIQINGRPDRF